ncbi:hypothetical protein IWX90DRAFT_236427 [Phyllosticta citrichinensis]|uniref:BHLH domain-containing protein n=1 Tax=Phyllosticta citrichinensis TaxID=1130410 RepID=A0ABR1XPQ3_9PEZI
MSPSPPAKGPGLAQGPDKPRLTEEEKKSNHIASEQKRRQAIRQGFDQLASIVPGMEGQGRSEAVVLEATVKYIREQYAEQLRLGQIAAAKGINPTSVPGLPETYRDTIGSQTSKDAALAAMQANQSNDASSAHENGNGL